MEVISFHSSEFPYKPIIYHISINKSVKNLIGRKEIKVVPYTYFRSDWLQGIELNPRPQIIICISLCHTPMDSQDANHTLHGKIYGGEYDPQELRILEMRQVFENSIGRCKDPLGKERSMVFVIGNKLDETKELIPEKKEVVAISVRNTMPDVAPIIYELWLKGLDYNDISVVAHVIHKMKETDKDAKTILTEMNSNNQLQNTPNFYMEKYFSA